MKLFRWKLEALSTLSCMSCDRYINILVQITPPGSPFDKLHRFYFSDQRTPDCDYIRGHGINKRQSHLNKSCVSKSKTKVWSMFVHRFKSIFSDILQLTLNDLCIYGQLIPRSFWNLHIGSILSRFVPY